MKKSILLALLMSTVLSASAQWVTIPDPNFANKLNELFPECMDGNLMDTQCPDVVNATSINVNSSNISDLTGIEYFVNLQNLDCGYNQLTALPMLASTLTSLNCAENNLTSLPGLPMTLTYLNCSFNALVSLPYLPPGITFLGCGNNPLTTLPSLPFALTNLVCSECNITSLPTLPPSLTELSCGSNQLTSLPELPATLDALVCADNPITSLPALPQSLTVLICSSSQLTELPELPSSLIYLACGNNDISCLPILPASLTNTFNFQIEPNPFSCLPNYVSAMEGDLLSMPLCDLTDLIENPYGCNSYTGIGGTVFEDENANCLENLSEDGILNANIQLLDEEDELIATTFTFGGDDNTIYNLVAETGNYSVQLITENMPFQVSCVDPGDLQEVILTVDEPSALEVDFGVECLPGFDVGVQSVVNSGYVFPGETHTLKIAAGDMSSWYGLQCAEGVSGTVSVNVTGPVSYTGPALGSLVPTETGDLQFTFDIADFSLVNMQQDFRLKFETDTAAEAGDQICVEIIVDPIDGDLNPTNNTYNHCYTVVNSYDPNIKQVWPHDVAPGYDDYFNYTIYFQNTGTAPAFNIRVADTLDTNLDLSTFQVTGYSHDCLTYVSGNVATFRFNNIMLPDSTSDFEGSIGYVQYRIKPVADLPVGTVIENTAHIYFDFNDAIVTNTTQNEYVITTSANHLQQQLATVFPNPANGQFNVLFTNSYSGMTHIEVYNLSGQQVMQRQVNDNRVELDLSEFPSGMYLLHVRNERGSEAVRIVKH